MSLLSAATLPVTMLLLLGAVLTACEGSPAEPPTDNSLPPSSASATRVAGSLAPSFSASTGEGFRFSSDEHRGEVMVLYFSFPG